MWWLYLDESGDLGFDFISKKPSEYFTICILATRLEIKKYAWNYVKDQKFGVYSLTLNKRRLYEKLAQDKNRVYNFIARQVIDQLPFEKADGGVQLIVDRSKGKKQVWKFNDYIRTQLEGRISPDVSLDFVHADSKLWSGIQWADMFAWGIFQKYERKNIEWYNTFSSKIQYDEQYL